MKGVNRIEVEAGTHRLLMGRPGRIGDFGNSGGQAINLALQFGARRIALVGFDMTDRAGIHWHGPHKILRNPQRDTLAKWRARLDAVEPAAASLGADIVNCSPGSALTAYRFADLGEIVARYGAKGEQ